MRKRKKTHVGNFPLSRKNWYNSCLFLRASHVRINWAPNGNEIAGSLICWLLEKWQPLYRSISFSCFTYGRGEEKKKIPQEILGTRDFSKPFQLGEYQTLMKEMCKNDYESFYEYFGMTSEKFDHLLSLVGPMLWKKSLYRKPTSPDERPAVTLRFLATGDSLQIINNYWMRFLWYPE